MIPPIYKTKKIINIKFYNVLKELYLNVSELLFGFLMFNFVGDIKHGMC